MVGVLDALPDSRPALARARLSGSLDFAGDSWAGLLSFEVMESVLLIEREGPVATLIMNRPQTKNALDPELLRGAGRGPRAGRGRPERARGRAHRRR